MEISCRTQHDELAARQAQGHQLWILLALYDALAAESLPEDGQPSQRGERGKYPPAHGLGVDRLRHGLSGCVLVRDVYHVEGSGCGRESGEIGGPVSEPDEVHRGSNVRWFTARAKAGVVNRSYSGPGAGRKFELGCFYAYDVQRQGRPVGATAPFAPLRLSAAVATLRRTGRVWMSRYVSRSPAGG